MSTVAAASTVLVPSSSTDNNLETSDLSLRHLADYHPTLWKDYFLQYASESLEGDEEMAKQVEALKEEVRKMLIISSKTENPLTKVEVIDSIQRLGLSHHFESEINELLHLIHNTYLQNNQILSPTTQDLHFLALLFKLLRQQGYPISPDMFNKFKDDQGNFNEKLASDVEGMLSLYEAAHLSVHGEDILDEALAFTFNHLRSVTLKSNPFLAAKLEQTLKQCPYRGLPRLEAHKYISIYHLHPSCDQLLLKLAKLDFNMLQKLHQKEFGNLCKWWNNKLDVERNYPYVRNRIVELCFWILTVYFEPHHSKSRSFMTKVIAFFTIVDDTFDAYGTIDELELINGAIQRMDIGCLDDLPEYIKLFYKELLLVFQEMDEQERKQGRSYSVHYAKQEFKKAVDAYMTEARWLKKKRIPTSKEYMNISTVSSCYAALATVSFVGMDVASEDVFKWAQTHPKAIKASSLICRLMDDFASSEFEHKREHIASVIHCYMREHGVTKEEAIGELKKVIESAWKDINEECIISTRASSKVPNPILMRVLNLTRFIDVMYDTVDNFTHSGGLMKDSIQLVLLHPLPI